MTDKKQKLIIIDSNALIHRAFHALPPSLASQEGQTTNAAYGFTMILIKALKELKPDYLAAAFDLPGKTFRHRQFPDYKAQRAKQPDELYQQIPIVKKILKAMKIPVLGKTDFEADDIIATISRLKTLKKKNIEKIIITGDQDVFQLIDENTKILAPHKGLSETVLYDRPAVKEKFQGLSPNQLIDFKALRGDPSDNIPGVPGIGEKGAINLLREFQTLEEIYQNIDSKKINERTKKLLKNHRQKAELSKKLVTLNDEVPIKFKLSECRWQGFNEKEIFKIFQKLNFKRLLNQLAGLARETGRQGSLFGRTPKERTEKDYQTITETKKAEKIINQLEKQSEFCLDTETSRLDALTAELLGISFSWKKNHGCYLTKKMVLKNHSRLENIFKNQKIKKIGHNLKYDLKILKNQNFSLKGIYFDTMIASYLLNSSRRQHNLSSLAFNELGHQVQEIEELLGQGKEKKTPAEIPTEKLGWYSCEDAEITYQLYQKLQSRLKEQKMFQLFQEIEIELIPVLAEMETVGIKINSRDLKKLSQKIAGKIGALEKKIYRLAGRKFNVASPAQLKQVLFQELEISSEGLAKTKTGISTAADELEKLSGRHRIIDLIIEFRELAKLKNTYLDTLPKLISRRDGRIHTSFNQTVTATGRLSSSEPNLQNIPIRTAVGREIRRAFVAPKGFKILKADYSQIELRIIASLADDPKMLEGFRKGIDIHRQTAALINNLPLEKVTPEIRRQAKEINFGVIYGMGARGVAQRTGLTNDQAKKFIEKYFDSYSKLKKYIEKNIENAREKGYAETLYGRRRYLPEISSEIQLIRAGAERMAINMPIQGTAADLIKLAMIKIHKKLKTISPKSRLILQVHDELVLEVPEKETAKTAEFVKKTMNEVVKLKAPIETKLELGDNWQELEEIND